MSVNHFRRTDVVVSGRPRWTMRAKRLVSAGMALVAIAATVVSLQSPVLAAAYYGPDPLIGYGSQKCINDPKNSTADNVAMIIYTCLTSTGDYFNNGLWMWKMQSDGYYWIVNLVSLKCLTILNASHGRNVPIIQFTCNSGHNEEWFIYDSFYPNGVRYVQIESAMGYCITVKNAGTSNGDTLLTYDCNASDNDFWTPAYNAI